MITMSQNDFCRLRMDEKIAALPVILTLEGEVYAVIANPKDIIVLTDLHPRMRNILKNQELRARVGMPKPTKIYRGQEVCTPSHPM